MGAWEHAMMPWHGGMVLGPGWAEYHFYFAIPVQRVLMCTERFRSRGKDYVLLFDTRRPQRSIVGQRRQLESTNSEICIRLAAEY